MLLGCARRRLDLVGLGLIELSYLVLGLVLSELEDSMGANSVSVVGVAVENWRASLIGSAREQFVSRFREMSEGGDWVLYRLVGTAAVKLERSDRRAGLGFEPLISGVQALSVDQMAAKIACLLL